MLLLAISTMRAVRSWAQAPLKEARNGKWTAVDPERLTVAFVSPLPQDFNVIDVAFTSATTVPPVHNDSLGLGARRTAAFSGTRPRSEPTLRPPRRSSGRRRSSPLPSS